LTGRRKPLLKAPEFILNAFYALKLGPYFNNKTAYEIMLERSKNSDDNIKGKDVFVNYRLSQLQSNKMGYLDMGKLHSRILEGK
jgi:hypothetical protein